MLIEISNALNVVLCLREDALVSLTSSKALSNTLISLSFSLLSDMMLMFFVILECQFKAHPDQAGNHNWTNGL